MGTEINHDEELRGADSRKAAPWPPASVSCFLIDRIREDNSLELRKPPFLPLIADTFGWAPWAQHSSFWNNYTTKIHNRAKTFVVWCGVVLVPNANDMPGRRAKVIFCIADRANIRSSPVTLLHFCEILTTDTWEVLRSTGKIQFEKKRHFPG